jgi:hypothetical protein
MYAISENHINKIKEDNSKIFSVSINPSSVEVECPNGFTADQECDNKLSFTDKDESIIKQRESVIGVWDNINTICFHLSIIIALTLAYSLWSGSKNKKDKRGDYNVLH